MSSDLRIRDETTDDVPRTFSVVEAAFGQRLQADLVDALRRSADPRLSLVAELRREIAGHVFFSPVTIEAADAPPAAQLSPVSVLPAHQGRGVGGELIRTGLSRCLALGWSAVFLVGNPAYYARFGFRMAGPLGFSYPGPMDPHLQVLELEPGALDGVVGRVRFDPAFEAVGAA